MLVCIYIYSMLFMIKSCVLSIFVYSVSVELCERISLSRCIYVQACIFVCECMYVCILCVWAASLAQPTHKTGLGSGNNSAQLFLVDNHLVGCTREHIANPPVLYSYIGTG